MWLLRICALSVAVLFTPFMIFERLYIDIKIQPQHRYKSLHEWNWIPQLWNKISLLWVLFSQFSRKDHNVRGQKVTDDGIDYTFCVSIGRVARNFEKLNAENSYRWLIDCDSYNFSDFLKNSIFPVSLKSMNSRAFIFWNSEKWPWRRSNEGRSRASLSNTIDHSQHV